MTIIELGDPALEPVPLGLERRVTLGGSHDAPDEQHDRISLGRPVCVALDPATVDAEAQAFLQGKIGSAFCLLALVCSFRADDDAPIDQAWIEVRLEAAGGGGATAPLAWSMEPLSVTDLVQVSQVAKLDASLKLKSDTVPIELGPSASKETTREFAQRVPYIEAHREGTSRPSWIFTRTPITEVRGVHRLRTVVQLVAGTTGRAEISAGATLRLKRLGLIPYRAKLRDLPEQQSVVLGT